MQRRKLLVIGHIFPESRATAAGWRMMKLMESFQQEYDIYFGTAAQRSDNSDELIHVKEIVSLPLNDDSVNETLLRIQPDVVIFDRFYTEEMFGWRVAEVLPNAWRILNSEDLHFVRTTREHYVKLHKEVAPVDTNQQWDADATKRELASILRCHKTLVISQWEMNLLEQSFQIPSSKLMFLPLQFPAKTDAVPVERANFCFIGNGIHKPNADAIQWLIQTIWPEIQNKLPQAKLNIACGYTSSHLRQLLSKKKNIQLLERIPDAGEFVQSHLVQLMPVRFGAGIKGKVLESIVHQTPFVSTSIAMEGISSDYPFMTDDVETFVDYAVGLFISEEQRAKAIDAMNNIQNDYPDFEKWMESTIDQLRVDAPKDWFAETLLMQQLNSTKFFSKYITAKNQSLAD